MTKPGYQRVGQRATATLLLPTNRWRSIQLLREFWPSRIDAAKQNDNNMSCARGHAALSPEQRQLRHSHAGRYLHLGYSVIQRDAHLPVVLLLTRALETLLFFATHKSMPELSDSLAPGFIPYDSRSRAVVTREEESGPAGCC